MFRKTVFLYLQFFIYHHEKKSIVKLIFEKKNNRRKIKLIMYHFFQSHHLFFEDTHFKGKNTFFEICVSGKIIIHRNNTMSMGLGTQTLDTLLCLWNFIDMMYIIWWCTARGVLIISRNFVDIFKKKIMQEKQGINNWTITHVGSLCCVLVKKNTVHNTFEYSVSWNISPLAYHLCWKWRGST